MSRRLINSKLSVSVTLPDAFFVPDKTISVFAAFNVNKFGQYILLVIFRKTLSPTIENVVKKRNYNIKYTKRKQFLKR